MKNTSSIIGKRLRQARLSAGLPQDKLGVMIGLDETTASTRISRYETGIHEPAFQTAVQLASVLGVPVPFFYCEDDVLAELILGWGNLSVKNKEKVRSMMVDAQQ